MSKKSVIKEKISKGYSAVMQEMRENSLTFGVYILLRVFVIVMMVLQMLNGNYENVFLSLLTFFLLMAPAAMQVVFKVDFPTTLEVVMLAFIFAAEILGEISAFYIRFPYWDTILHTINGFLCAAIGFSLVDILNHNDRFHMELSPLFMAILAFSFSMTIGVLWEFFEYAADAVLGIDMQKDTIVNSINSTLLDPTGRNVVVSLNDIRDVKINGNSLGVGGYIDIGLKDTMEDLIVNFIGAVIFSTIGYFYVKGRKPRSFISRFVPVRKRKSKEDTQK